MAGSDLPSVFRVRSTAELFASSIECTLPFICGWARGKVYGSFQS